MSDTTLEEWLRRIESVHPAAVELGLDRVSAVANRLQLLPVTQSVITVAGTNGKGSVVALLEGLFQVAEVTTGAFTSPHLLRFNERIHVAGVEASDAEIVRAFTDIEKARGEILLTYFEFATLAALLVFAAHDPDVIILEVGLGGRLDSVNMVDPDVSVITSIDLDHQDWLGDTRDAIAREKAGILRASTPAVIGEPEPPEALREAV
ncbi:MAG: bifunctional tetrahydrofolate synthase/dihydrofolate synthase, partial [Halieaceae bacterium]|nr:bifunctional tetrahydrofolate synthase/dihydrofolate synthase [Halieaceae bacterium]